MTHDTSERDNGMSGLTVLLIGIAVYLFTLLLEGVVSGTVGLIAGVFLGGAYGWFVLGPYLSRRWF